MKKAISILLSLVIVAATAAVSSTVFANNSILSDKINEPATGIENIDVWDDGEVVTESATDLTTEPASETTTEPAAETTTEEESTTEAEETTEDAETETEAEEAEETTSAEKTTTKASSNKSKTSPSTGCDF